MLILGAGMVASPVVKYFLEKTDYKITVADQIYHKAQKLKGSSSRVEALELDMNEINRVEAEVSRANAVISILPFSFHPQVAELCIRHNKHLITASYVSDSMRKLESQAQAAGVILLNEIGLDPGIDHMEAMRMIHEIKNQDGQIDSFISFCGGLPAPEANTNPLGYKFSWSPLGVLLAGKNPAKYLKSGKEVTVSPLKAFNNPERVFIEGMGELDGYPNRNSLPYIDIYGIPSTRTLLRGTLRYQGWCPFIRAALEMGFLDEENKNRRGFTYAGVVRELIQSRGDAGIKKALSEFLQIDIDSDVIKCFEWLGLIQEKPLPLESGSALDILAHKLQEKLQYEAGERDMIILQHRITAKFPNGTIKKNTSTLVDFGIPYGDTSMARTVGLPLAIGTRLIIEGKIKKAGILIPVIPEIYHPILEELKDFGIAFKETSQII